MLIFSNIALADLTTGLVAYYCFDDINNLSKDCSSNGNNGKAEGSVTSVTGYKGMAAQFGGFKNPADIHIPNSNSLKFSKDFSVAYAVKITGFDGMDGWGNYASSGVHAVFAKMFPYENLGIVFLLGGNSEGNISLWTPTNGNTSSIEGVAPNSGVNKWVHFTYVFSNTQHTLKLYANGVLIASKTGFSYDFTGMNTKDIYLGNQSYNGWFPLNGNLDEVRIYNRALSNTEINSLYNQGGQLSGSIKRLSSYSVTCKNDTTGQIIVIPTTNITTYDCESNGLKFTPKQTVTITINGKTY
jgi:hypothetical protein